MTALICPSSSMRRTAAGPRDPEELVIVERSFHGVRDLLLRELEFLEEALVPFSLLGAVEVRALQVSARHV